jgi:cytochrome c-type biogenesis protein CcmE
LKPRTKRAIWIAAGIAALGVATTLVLNAFQSNMVFYITPTQVAANEVPRDRPFRMGGWWNPAASSGTRTPSPCASR